MRLEIEFIMLFSLLNVNNFTDGKNLFLRDTSEKYHVQFFTEINVDGMSSVFKEDKIEILSDVRLNKHHLMLMLNMNF